MKSRVSALPDADPLAAPRLSDAAKVVSWGLVFWGGNQIAGAAFERNAVAMVVVQAGLAEWGAGRMAIPWSDPTQPRPAWNAVARRAAIGAALGLGCAALVAGIALALRSAAVAGIEAAPGAMLLGLLVSAFGAVRDELLLRGVVVRATRLLPAAVTLVVCGLAAAAARFGTDWRVTSALLPEALRGAALGALWLRDRGAWMACGANAGWTWASGSLFGGALLDVRFGNENAVAVPVLFVAALAAGLLALPRAVPERAA
jgi:hypothetical protein